MIALPTFCLSRHQHQIPWRTLVPPTPRLSSVFRSQVLVLLQWRPLNIQNHVLIPLVRCLSLPIVVSETQHGCICRDVSLSCRQQRSTTAQRWYLWADLRPLVHTRSRQDRSTRAMAPSIKLRQRTFPFLITQHGLINHSTCNLTHQYRSLVHRISTVTPSPLSICTNSKDTRSLTSGVSDCRKANFHYFTYSQNP